MYIYTIIIKQTIMTTSELRNNLEKMTKEDFISMRDKLESNWDNSLRPLMSILSLGCVNKFGKTLSQI